MSYTRGERGMSFGSSSSNSNSVTVNPVLKESQMSCIPAAEVYCGTHLEQSQTGC